MPFPMEFNPLGLTSALDERSASCSSRFISIVRPQGTQCIGGLQGQSVCSYYGAQKSPDSTVPKYIHGHGTRSLGARGSIVVEGLCYKPEGRGIASQWGGFFLVYLILLAALWPWGRLSLQQKWVPGILKKKPGGKGRPVCRADNLAAIC
jgi:hypothetical protein